MYTKRRVRNGSMVTSFLEEAATSADVWLR
jgi:hypothetical protein